MPDAPTSNGFHHGDPQRADGSSERIVGTDKVPSGALITVILVLARWVRLVFPARCAPSSRADAATSDSETAKRSAGKLRADGDGVLHGF